MRLVLVGGAAGVGKSTAARHLLRSAAKGPLLIQWVDVDALWLHQPWRVDDVTTGMLHANLRAVMSNAAAAEVDILIVTWVFQNEAMHDVVRRLAPDATRITTVQLHLAETSWRQRFKSDDVRPEIDQFFVDRYHQAQATPVDHVIDVDGLAPGAVAAAINHAVGLGRFPKHQ
ncbi:hypothetical protein J7E83_10185 [Arthrobacter sp. ISL-48]|uniref:AAA family ATPase n=1 Tax=Arthrobacter sp. ISL-48 TaxID=2819110 RepID=UPI001BE9C3CB|nr:AAA family ATPase [Arthrobacter sp. ISL-48]MBT2532491.1 hypothetical protein [Arthrobacter sp. ISL-48]